MDLHLNSYGAYLHVKDDLFEVRVTDEKGEKQTKMVAAHKVRTIFLSQSMALSTDAVRLALVNNVDIVFLNRGGYPMGRVWHSKLGSTTRIRKCQLQASLGAQGLEWTKAWIVQKLDNQREFLQDLKKHRSNMHAYLDEKIGQIGRLAESVANLQAPRVADVADTLRGLEGTAGRLYFEALAEAVPPADRFEGRSFRPAKDPFNAFLNYGYGILYSTVEKALMVAGLDPYVGFLHRDDYNQKSMVFDFIEPYRVHVDRAVFKLFSGKKVNQTHTGPITNGITLEKPGKELIVTAFNQAFVDDKIRHQGRNLSREHALQLDAHAFAQALMASETND